MMLVRPPGTNLKLTCQSWLLFLGLVLSPHPAHLLSINALDPMLPSERRGGGVSLWTDVCHPPPTPSGCRHLKKSKFSFPPTWPVNWLLRGEQPDSPTQSFSNICNNKGFVVLEEPTSATSATCYCIFTTQSRVLSVMNQIIQKYLLGKCPQGTRGLKTKSSGLQTWARYVLSCTRTLRRESLAAQRTLSRALQSAVAFHGHATQSSDSTGRLILCPEVVPIWGMKSIFSQPPGMIL